MQLKDIKWILKHKPPILNGGSKDLWKNDNDSKGLLSTEKYFLLTLEFGLEKWAKDTSQNDSLRKYNISFELNAEFTVLENKTKKYLEITEEMVLLILWKKIVL